MFHSLTDRTAVGFFTRLVVRLLRWCDWREATFVTGFATIPLDRDNDLLLKLHQSPPSQNRGRIQEASNFLGPDATDSTSSVRFRQL
ncbi:hypothetical protein MTO96_008166 [Rhipicephalus appendiculatus]